MSGRLGVTLFSLLHHFGNREKKLKGAIISYRTVAYLVFKIKLNFMC